MGVVPCTCWQFVGVVVGVSSRLYRCGGCTYNQMRAGRIHAFLALLLFCWRWQLVHEWLHNILPCKSEWTHEAPFNHWGQKNTWREFRGQGVQEFFLVEWALFICQLKSHMAIVQNSNLKKTSMFMVDVPLFTRGWNYGNPTPIKATSTS